MEWRGVFPPDNESSAVSIIFFFGQILNYMAVLDLEQADMTALTISEDSLTTILNNSFFVAEDLILRENDDKIQIFVRILTLTFS